MAFGVTPSGFVLKRYEDLRAEVEAELRTRISPSLNTSPDSVIGILISVYAEKLAEAWEVLEAVYRSFDPDAAEAASLDAVAALTGTQREGATKSRTPGSVNVNPGVYPAGTLFASVSGSPSSLFVNLATVTNGGVLPADFPVDFEAVATGPTVANAGTLTVIATPVVGWNSVTNTADATLGAEVEGDAALRERRENEIRSPGSTNVDAIRADILRDGPGVLSATVLENDTDAIDVNGLLPHSIEAIVYGPAVPTLDDDQAIAEIVFGTKAGGIGTNGTTIRNVEDAQGNSHPIRFTRPTFLDVFFQVTVEVDAATFAGAAAVQDAIASADDSLGPGDPLYWSRVICLPYDVPGVRHVSIFGLALSILGPFVLADVAPGIRQVVRTISANVAVTVVPV
jgi:uncharacterized phage protein gp47/JayE